MKRRILAVVLAAASPAVASGQESTPSPTPEPTRPPADASLADLVDTGNETPSIEPESSAPGSGRRSSLGGYGEIHIGSIPGKAGGAEADIHRLILFVGYPFASNLTFYSEIEVEHADQEFAVEQAYIEWAPHRAAALRGGVMLVPIGIQNVFHEPPTFHGVERTEVDRVIIPSTWREVAGSIAGNPADWLEYEVMVLDGLDAATFTGSGGLRGGRQQASEAQINDVAWLARVNVSPVIGVDVAFAGYRGAAGQDQPGLSHASVTLAETDLRARAFGATVRAQYVHGWIGGADEIDAIAATDPIGSEIEGWYVEGAYDVLTPLRAKRPSVRVSVEPFVRYEWIDTQLAMPSGFLPNAALKRSITTAGLTVRPISRLALKADYQWTDARLGNPADVWHLGMGWMF